MTFLAALLLVVTVLNVVCAVLNVRNARRNKASAAQLDAASRRVLQQARLVNSTTSHSIKVLPIAEDAAASIQLAISRHAARNARRGER